MMQTPEEHSLNQKATEILLALNNLEPEQENQLVLEHSGLPILELMQRVLHLETQGELLDKWLKLQQMPDAKAMKLIEGPHQKNSLVLSPEEIELLREDPIAGVGIHPKPKRQTRIEGAHQGLKQNLKWILEDVAL